MRFQPGDYTVNILYAYLKISSTKEMRVEGQHYYSIIPREDSLSERLITDFFQEDDDET